MAFHTLRISDEQWDTAKRIAAEHLETTGITTTPSNVLLSLLNNALKAYDNGDLVIAKTTRE